MNYNDFNENFPELLHDVMYEISQNFFGGKYCMIANDKRIKFKKSIIDKKFDKYAFQIKKWYGWETIAETYHSTHKNFYEMATYLYSKYKQKLDNVPFYIDK